MNKVTVVIPCYNNFETIVRTYQSILNQTFKDYCVIIVNDGSDAKTTELVNSFKEDKLRVINQENKGVVTARNNGIEQASSQFVLTLDGDDSFEPTFLEEAVVFLENNIKYGVISCNYNVINQDGLMYVSQLEDNPSLNDLLIKNRLPANALFRRLCWEEVNGYDKDFDEGFEDWDFWINIASKGWKIKILNNPLLNVFVKKNSRNKVAMKNQIELRRLVFNKYENLYKNINSEFSDELFKEIETLKKTIRKRDSSLDMRLGKLIFNPLRKIKSFFK
ncbi:glycosyltransferase family A protein [uncultured Lacinutrix sp.]|uniref:glycosyltransferase family 2 protein n=1 Tax=uncultured Lacinutrix sp. TaxID=574032 RepID=UPI00260536C2|nr:glycosyltransferase family A protein [uncultured Lacinutrix sp.]